jgi:hypothetical protein
VNFYPPSTSSYRDSTVYVYNNDLSAFLFFEMYIYMYIEYMCVCVLYIQSILHTFAVDKFYRIIKVLNMRNTW